MVNPSILYKRLKTWVTNPKNSSGNWHNYIMFCGNNSVVATNTHKMVMVKNYPVAEAHFETVDGATVQPEQLSHPSDKSLKEWIDDDLALRTLKVIPKAERCQYSTQLDSSWFSHMKNSFDFLKRFTKVDGKRDGCDGMCMINFHDSKLFAISGGHRYGMKFLLHDELTPSVPWHCYWNAKYLLEVMDLLIDTGVRTANFSVQLNRTSHPLNKPEAERWTGLWKVETDDLIMVATSVRVSASENREFIFFTQSEAICSPNGAFITERKPILSER